METISASLRSTFVVIVLLIVSAVGITSIAKAQTNSSSTPIPSTSGDPVISSISVRPSSDGTSATITWVTNESATTQIAYGTTTPYPSFSAMDSSLVTNHAVTLSGLRPETTYHFEVVSTDSFGRANGSPDQTFTTSRRPTASGAPLTTLVAATTSPNTSGSESSSSIPTSATLNTVKDSSTVKNDAISSTTNTSPTYTAVAPTISNAYVNPGYTSATVFWSTDQSTTGYVNYGTTTSSTQTAMTNSSGLMPSHSATLSDLQPATTYRYQIVSTNSGSTSTSTPWHSFTTLSAGTATTTSVSTSSDPSTATSTSSSTPSVQTLQNEISQLTSRITALESKLNAMAPSTIRMK